MRSFTVEGLEGVEFKSQLGQDAWVAAMTGLRRDGYFVEIGGADGIDLSNTYVLETVLGWRGISAEASPDMFAHLTKNRPGTTCVERAVFPGPETTMEFLPQGVLGTLIGFESVDMHKSVREEFLRDHDTIKVKTIDPNTMLRENGAPDYIDYMSIDTEGSEWEILSAIDPDEWKIGLFTIEHNFNEEKRDLITAALKPRGYQRICALLDDWFYNADYMRRLNGATAVDFEAVTDKFCRESDFSRG